MIINPHGSVIICEDVRQEVNGKAMYIGVYQDVMYFYGPPPWTIQSGLFFHVVYRERHSDRVPKLRFEIRGMSKSKPEHVLLGINPDIQQEPPVPVSSSPFDFEKDSEPLLQMTLTARLAPFVIEEETKISIIMHRDGEDIFLERLRVLQGSEGVLAAEG